MKGQVFNPYLPGTEYIPDGEPRIFGGRLYIYGSHDRFGAPFFCFNDYVCWSASAEDFSDWRFEGTIYRKKQDPKNKQGLRFLFAPDVVEGKDGRYYLYYAFDFMGIMGVAVCDTPCGEFQFYGHIHHPDGTLWGRRRGDLFPFDPGVLVDDDDRVYLYSGFGVPVPRIMTGGKKLKFDGGYVLELEQDMVTIKTPQKLLFPKKGPGSFSGHEFFEASSIRKYCGKYYFVYSSCHNHELCYAVSNKPDGGFVFCGTLVSIGDVFLNGNEDEKQASNYLGNTHGGLLELDGQYYVFYHRQTNRSSYARQACAEKLELRSDGGFWQAEVTSCGMNGGPLKGNGCYEARIACNLRTRKGTGRYDGICPKIRLRTHPYFTQDEKDNDPDARQYIANMRNGAVAGFKYFWFQDLSEIRVVLRGKAKGKLWVWSDYAGMGVVAEIIVDSKSRDWTEFTAVAETENGEGALYFCYEGQGSIDFLKFTLI